MEHLLYKNIVSHPEICSGRPIIKGTRLTVQSVMSFVLAGDDDKTILNAFPRLTPGGLDACKEFTSMLFEKETMNKLVSFIK